MDRPFIKLMCNSYYNDYNFNKVIGLENRTEVVEDMIIEMNSLMDALKFEDEESYFYVHKELDRTDQQKLIYLLLSEYAIERYNLFTPKIYDNHLMQDPEALLLSENFKIDDTLKNLTYQKNDNIKIDKSNKLLGLSYTSMTLLSVLGALAFWKSISRSNWKIMVDLNNINNSISNWINEKTRSGRVKRMLLVTNFEKCWKHCGISSSDLSKYAGLYISNGLASQSTIKNVDCLTDCYLNWSLQNMEHLAKMYVECLQVTGERSIKLSDMNIFLKEPQGADCKAYYDHLKEHKENFHEVLDVLYRYEDPAERTRKIEYYTRKYDTILNDTLNTKPTFTPNKSKDKFKDRVNPAHK